jgi:hypothetical protein
VSNTATTGQQNASMTFYNLQSGQKTVASNIDWHLAVSMRPSQFPNNTLQGTTLRINEAFGVQAYRVTGFTADSFSVAIDTQSLPLWQRVYDSDTTMDEGALNTGKNIGVYNYGWGVYSGPPLHNVVGDKVFVFALPNHVFKKMLIEQLDRDTAWDIRIANLDNSDLQRVHISKKDYPGKNFVYLNILNQVVTDKEPLSSDWDLQFLKYAATDVIPGKTSPVLGVWINKGRTVAKRSRVDVADNNFSGLSFSPSLNTIGWNWKYLVNIQQSLSGKNFAQTINYYVVEDSLAYFVTSASGDIYKLVFTAYEGPGTGIIRFETTLVAPNAISETPQDAPIGLYPNPASSFLNVDLNLFPATVKVFDIEGKLLAQTTVSNSPGQLDVSAFENGTYLLMLSSAEKTVVKKFSVVR